jgi:hypothetical protein
MDIAAKIAAYEAEHGSPPDNDELVAFIDPMLGESKQPTEAQCLAIGEAVGMLRDDGEWFKSAAPSTYGKLIAQCCAHGMTVLDAMDIIDGGVSIGCEEYGG